MIRILKITHTATLASSVLAVILAVPSRADEPNRQARQYIGHVGCRLCHNQDVNRLLQLSPDGKPLTTNLNTVSDVPLDLCRMNESAIWRDHDKHAAAFAVLDTRNPRNKIAAKMEAILQRTPERGPNYKIVNDKNCLSCHADWHWKRDKNKPPTFQGGVTCEACHGPSSQWGDLHWKPTAQWRVRTAAEKEATGFFNIRDAAVRAKRCFACHIGNAAEGKVVTHEMYAAGHPPLPGIEVEAFSSQMPSHWRNLREKGNFVHRQAFLEGTYHTDETKIANDLPQTRSVIIGGVVALREALTLFKECAADESVGRWPELAVFDCQACHHDLRYPSSRQLVGYGRRIPGRPTMFSWPNALLKVGIRHVAPGDEAFAQQWKDYQSAIADFQADLNARPFGRPETLQVSTKKATDWLDGLIAKLSASEFNEASAKSSLNLLVNLKREDYPDYHSARQILWAYSSIQGELAAGYPKFTPGMIQEKSLAQIRADIMAFDQVNRRRSAERKGFSDAVSAMLIDATKTGGRASQQPLTMPLFLPAGTVRQIENELPTSLGAISSYDPLVFERVLRELAKKTP